MHAPVVSASTIVAPSFSPAQLVLLNALQAGGDERTVAREISVNVPELRVMITRLSQDLQLPAEIDVAKQFSQVKRAAGELSKSRTAMADSIAEQLKLPAGAVLDEKWQKKLVEVAKAIAKGVYVVVDPYKIRPMHGQPRESFPVEEQASMESSLGIVGQIQDIIIRKKPPPTRRTTTNLPDNGADEREWRLADTDYEICDGERRWRGVISKGLLEVRAKLIEIDDQGAYLVAGISNFNRVGHTPFERARNIERLMKGDPPFPISVIAVMQGISVVTANKLLDTLKLPPDILEFMDPVKQRQRGQEVLGASTSYELARLAKNPVLHEHARDLATRYVTRQIKLPQLRNEVDVVLSRSGGAARNVLKERRLPSRRINLADARITVAIDSLQVALGVLEGLKADDALPHGCDIRYGTDLDSICALVEKCKNIIGYQSEPKKA